MTSQETLKIFDEYYYTTYEDISKYVVCNCSNIEDVKDIIQNIYMELYKVLSKKKEIQNYKTYIKGIAKHKIKDYYRFHYKDKVIALFSNKKEKDLVDTIPSNVDIEKSFLKKEDMDNIWNYLKGKKVIISKIFYLYYYTDSTIKEISELLGISESNIKNYLYRTLKELKIFLERDD